MPHAMYFIGNSDTVTKFNQVPYQTIEYNENGMFTAKLMNDTPIEIFIDNGATPSILPLCTYNKFPILCTYPKTKSNIPIHTGGGLITSHFWLEIPFKLQYQTIQIKALVCDSECPYDLILGRISMAQLSAWQDYVTNKLYICRAHWDGGNSQGGTRHSLPPVRRRGSFNSNDQLNSSTER